ncbi:MAG TPA: hypothetical protein VMT71_11230 [Syntrophorhabdales bacterium]|nr:hypothetical protein [Syntrophorhabdales bacterium]
MKKVSVVVMAVAVALLLGMAAHAAPQASGQGVNQPVDVNALRQFQKETLPLRDEMAAKRLELRNEYAQPTPDLAKIAKIQHEMIDLRTKIQTAAQKQGLPAFGRGWMMAGGGCGAGYGRGFGPGAGNGPGPGRGGFRGGHGAGWGGGCGGCSGW